jgi:hypothetical protein
VSPYGAWPFLSDPSHPFLSAVWAVLIHGVLALVAIGPIVWRSRRRLPYGLLTFAGGSLLDLDHFIAAGSLDLHTIETLSSRPVTHSLLFVLALGVVALALTRRVLVAWSVFAVNLAHVLFDAAGGNERFFYPLTHPDGLAWLLCPLGTLALLGVSAALAATLMSAPPSGHRERERRDVLSVG